MVDLSVSREKLDKIDKEIVDLFIKRNEVVLDVAKYKMETGKPILDEEREKEKINTLKDLVDSDYEKESVEELFTLIMKLSRKLQQEKIGGQ